MNLLELIDKLGNHLNRMDQRITQLEAIEDRLSLIEAAALEDSFLGNIMNRLEALEKRPHPTIDLSTLEDRLGSLEDKVEDLDSADVVLADDFQSNFEDSLGNMTSDEILSEDAIREAVRDILRNATIEV